MDNDRGSESHPGRPNRVLVGALLPIYFVWSAARLVVRGVPRGIVALGRTAARSLAALGGGFRRLVLEAALVAERALRPIGWATERFRAGLGAAVHIVAQVVGPPVRLLLRATVGIGSYFLDGLIAVLGATEATVRIVAVPVARAAVIAVRASRFALRKAWNWLKAIITTITAPLRLLDRGLRAVARGFAAIAAWLLRVTGALASMVLERLRRSIALIVGLAGRAAAVVLNGLRSISAVVGRALTTGLKVIERRLMAVGRVAQLVAAAFVGALLRPIRASLTAARAVASALARFVSFALRPVLAAGAMALFALRSILRRLRAALFSARMSTQRALTAARARVRTAMEPLRRSGAAAREELRLAMAGIRARFGLTSGPPPLRIPSPPRGEQARPHRQETIPGSQAHPIGSDPGTKGRPPVQIGSVAIVTAVVVFGITGLAELANIRDAGTGALVILGAALVAGILSPAADGLIAFVGFGIGMAGVLVAAGMVSRLGGFAGSAPSFASWLILTLFGGASFVPGRLIRRRLRSTV